MTGHVPVGAFGADREALVAAAVHGSLASLGGSVEEWADALFEAGIRGRVSDETSCPLAVVLTEDLNSGAGGHLATPVEVTVDATSIIVTGPGYRWALPSGGMVSTFVQSFDGGLWPFLTVGRGHLGRHVTAQVQPPAPRNSGRFAPELPAMYDEPYDDTDSDDTDSDDNEERTHA